MADLPANDPASKRRPALRGVVMQDISQGAERTRAWPRSRGRPKTKAEAERMALFRGYQLASKYVAPDIYRAVIEASKGTPLLPRDLLTMMFSNRLLAFILPDGRILWPMVARSDVSKALTTITQEPGAFLRYDGENWGPYLGPDVPDVEGWLDLLTTEPGAFLRYDGAHWVPWLAPDLTQLRTWLDLIDTDDDVMMVRRGGEWTAEAIPVSPALTGYFRAWRSLAALNVTGDNTVWQVTFNTVSDAQTWAALNVATGAVTLSQAGSYHIETMVSFNGGALQDFGFVGILVNGTVLWQNGLEFTDEAFFRLGCATTVHCNANDVVTVTGQVGGSTKTMDVLFTILETTIKITKIA